MLGVPLFYLLGRKLKRRVYAVAAMYTAIDLAIIASAGVDVPWVLVAVSLTTKWASAVAAAR